MQERFLVTDNVPEGFVEEVQRLGFSTDYVPVLDNDILAGIIHQYEGIVVSTQISLYKDMLDKAIRLKYILRPGSGLDNINVPYAAEKGILLLNSPEANSVAVAEHAIGLLLGLLNYIPRAYEQVKQMQWIRKPNTGSELKYKTVGIIGYGHTGSAVVERLQGFGCRILVYDKHKEVKAEGNMQPATLEQIQAEANVLSLHVPLTAETHHLVNEEFIAGFENRFYLVNTARGPIVKTPAVTDALISGKLEGAALDVIENEKLGTYTEDEKNELMRLLQSGNVIITPHIAGWTQEARKNIFFVVLDKFKAVIAA